MRHDVPRNLLASSPVDASFTSLSSYRLSVISVRQADASFDVADLTGREAGKAIEVNQYLLSSLAIINRSDMI